MVKKQVENVLANMQILVNGIVDCTFQATVIFGIEESLR